MLICHVVRSAVHEEYGVRRPLVPSLDEGGQRRLGGDNEATDIDVDLDLEQSKIVVAAASANGTRTAGCPDRVTTGDMTGAASGDGAGAAGRMAVAGAVAVLPGRRGGRELVVSRYPTGRACVGCSGRADALAVLLAVGDLAVFLRIT